MSELLEEPRARDFPAQHAYDVSDLMARRTPGSQPGEGIMEVQGRLVRYGALIESRGVVFVPGVFADSLATLDAAARRLPMGYEHHMFSRFQSIGSWGAAEERQNGLYGKQGRISDTVTGRDAATLVEDGAVTGISIGFGGPVEFEVAEPNEPKEFETPFGKKTYKQSDWALYFTQAELLEASLVAVPADDQARIGTIQSGLAKAEIALPGLKADAGRDDAVYSMALLMGGRGAAAFVDLPDVEHFALYTRLAAQYAKHGLTPPAYQRRPEYEHVAFQHDERQVFADRYLRKNLAAVVAGAGGFEGQLSPGTREEAEKAMRLLTRLLTDPDVEQFAAMQADLRRAAALVSSLRQTPAEGASE